MTKLLNTRCGTVLTFTTLGFGGAEIGNMGSVQTDDVAIDTVRTALARGLRYFDTAPLYGLGLSEWRIGQALQPEDRSSYLVSSKVGLLLDEDWSAPKDVDFAVVDPAGSAHYDYSYDAIMRSFEASLKRLGLASIDILYVHDIDAETHASSAMADTHMRALVEGGGWRALDELRSSGVVKAIGAGLNEWPLCQRMLIELDPDIFLLAGRYTLLEQGAAATFLPACAERGVGVVVGGPFNSGILATGANANAIYNYGLASERILAKVRNLEVVCARHGVALPSAALQYPLGHPAVISVIPGCTNTSQVNRNADMMATDIPTEFWKDLFSAGYATANAVVAP